MYLNLKDEFLKIASKFSVNFVSAEHSKISRFDGIYHQWTVKYSFTDVKTHIFTTDYKQRAQRPKVAADAFADHLEELCGSAAYPDLNEYASLLLGRKIFDYRKPKEIFTITGLHYGPQGATVRYARKGIGTVAKKLRPEHRLVCRPIEAQTKAEGYEIISLNEGKEIDVAKYPNGNVLKVQFTGEDEFIQFTMPILPTNPKALKYCIEQDLDVFGLSGKLK